MKNTGNFSNNIADITSSWSVTGLFLSEEKNEKLALVYEMSRAFDAIQKLGNTVYLTRQQFRFAQSMFEYLLRHLRELIVEYQRYDDVDIDLPLNILGGKILDLRSNI